MSETARPLLANYDRPTEHRGIPKKFPKPNECFKYKTSATKAKKKLSLFSFNFGK